MTISLVFAMNNLIYNDDLQARADSFASLTAYSIDIAHSDFDVSALKESLSYEEARDNYFIKRSDFKLVRCILALFCATGNGHFSIEDFIEHNGRCEKLSNFTSSYLLAQRTVVSMSQKPAANQLNTSSPLFQFAFPLIKANKVYHCMFW